MLRYRLVICWSDEDQVFVVSLPDFADVYQPRPHGETYEEAARNGREVRVLLIETYHEQGKPLPTPAVSA